jgi:hypothetical protein
MFKVAFSHGGTSSRQGQSLAGAEPTGSVRKKVDHVNK